MYHNAEHGFSLKLPSPHWKAKQILSRSPASSKQAKDGPSIVTFTYSTYSSNDLPVIVNVSFARKQSREEFRQTSRAFKEHVLGDTGLLAAPVAEEGINPSGNPYLYVTACNQEGNKYYFVACSYTWLKDKGLTVKVLFQGKGEMEGATFKTAKYGKLEEAARLICLSVE
jgi:hypothetical protein